MNDSHDSPQPDDMSQAHDTPQTSGAPEPDGSTPAPQDLAALDARVVDVIKTCYDPEIPVNIYELGLIYQIRVKAHGAVHVTMTLTAPNCPAAQSLPAEVKEKVENLPGVSEAEVEVVWDPPWTIERMSEAAKLQLGFF
jgi:FeS assembly SUF system protein